MQRIIIAAAVLLLFQIGLIFTVHLQDSALETHSPEALLFDVTAEKITDLQITAKGEKGTTHLLLTKKRKKTNEKQENSAWVLPEHFSVPANSAQVDALLKKLTDLRYGLAVATTKEGAKRFQTAEDDYLFHLVLREGKTVVGDCYLGNSAGVRQIHARRADGQEVVSIPLASFELDPALERWLDPNLTSFALDDVQEVVYDDITLKRNEQSAAKQSATTDNVDGESETRSTWLLLGADPAEVLKEEVDSFLSYVSDLDVEAVLDPAIAEPLFSKQTLRFTVQENDGQKVDYVLVKDGERQILKMSDAPWYLQVKAWQVEQIGTFNREKFFKKEEPEENPSPSIEPELPSLPHQEGEKSKAAE